MSWTPRRRFWKAARIRALPDGFAMMLDARPLRTPGKAPLVVPTAALAEAIAGEWDAVGAEIRPERMPLTRAANTAIDRVAPDPAAVVAAVAEYGGSDLLCYRAAAPRALFERQAAGWDPWLEWSARALGAPLVAVTGLIHHPQPPRSLAVLRQEVAAHDAFGLAALQELVTISGSLVLALAVGRGALCGEDAWALSRIDETWQEEQWGRDVEAEAAAAARREDLLRAERLLRMLDGITRDNL